MVLIATSSFEQHGYKELRASGARSRAPEPSWASGATGFGWRFSGVKTLIRLHSLVISAAWLSGTPGHRAVMPGRPDRVHLPLFYAAARCNAWNWPVINQCAP